jgi:UPF0716 family protein affecting phage T7 exclusion
MNRGFFIILVPAFLVAIGYIVVFRYIGISPAYWRLILPVVLFAGAMWWFGRRGRKEVTKYKEEGIRKGGRPAYKAGSGSR